MDESISEQLDTIAEAESAAVAEAKEEFLRFSLAFRLQHIGMFVSVLTLIVTGMPLKYPDAAASQGFFNLVGGVQASGIIHRVAAVLLMAVGAFHMYWIIFTKGGRFEFLHLIPKFKDFADVGRNLLYFFGFSKSGAKFDRYSYMEKFDYWAVYWGMVVMIGSGLILWFYSPIMQIWPKMYLDVALEAHSDEALLATLAILVWHFYNVHFNPRKFPMSMTWLTGKISKEEMIHEHPVEYDRLISQSRESAESEGED